MSQKNPSFSFLFPEDEAFSEDSFCAVESDSEDDRNVAERCKQFTDRAKATKVFRSDELVTAETTASALEEPVTPRQPTKRRLFTSLRSVPRARQVKRARNIDARARVGVELTRSIIADRNAPLRMQRAAAITMAYLLSLQK